MNLDKLIPWVVGCCVGFLVWLVGEHALELVQDGRCYDRCLIAGYPKGMQNEGSCYCLGPRKEPGKRLE